MIRRVLAVSAPVLAVAIFFLFQNFSHGSVQDRVIVYDGTSFFPAELTVAYGETVTFKNESTGPFWPASNLHPEHLIYSEFDPKKPIAEGESWTFTFTKEGRWNFHDHITPTAKGSVLVLSQMGTVVEEDCRDDEHKQKCFEEQVLNALENGGVEGAYDLFAQLYESDNEFAEGCHGLVHLIGEHAYTQFINDETFPLTAKTQYCGFGFFHGFMETLLVQSGDVELARSFCRYVEKTLGEESPTAAGACLHGVGHGAVDGADPGDWGDAAALTKTALRLCEKVAENEHDLHVCATGVFDGIGIAFIEGEYGLTASKEHVYELCLKVDPVFKSACYDQTNTLISTLAVDMQEALAIIRNIPERAYYQDALKSLAATFGRLFGTDTEKQDMVIELCLALEEEQSRQTCISGFAVGLVELGPPNEEYVWGMDFCTSEELSVTERTSCFQNVVNNSSYFFSASEMHTVCDLVAKEIDISAIEQCTS